MTKILAAIGATAFALTAVAAPAQDGAAILRYAINTPGIDYAVYGPARTKTE